MVTATACDSYTLNGKAYTESGTYTQTLKNAAGCDSVITLKLTISPSYSRTDEKSICQGESYKGHATSGTYTENLTMASGCDSIVTTILTVKEKPATPVVSISGNVLTSDATDGNQWYGLGWGAYEGSTGQAFTAQSSGEYFAIVTSGGCTSDTSNIVEYDQKGIKAGFTYTVGDNNKVIFTDGSSSNVGSWYWKYGDGSMGTGKGGAHTYKAAGTYNVCLTVLDSAKKVTDKACKNVSIGTALCNITAGFNYDITDMTVRLKDASAGDVAQYYWSFGDGTTSTIPSPVHVYTGADYYLVSLSVSNANKKCSDSYSEMVEIGAVSCHADFDYATDTTTARKVAFVNTSEGVLTNYYWDFNDGTSSVDKSPAHIFQQDGNYEVSLTVAGNNFSCMDNIVLPVTIGTVKCDAGFSWYVDSTDNTVYFKERALGLQNSVLWNFGDGSISTAHSPSHVYTSPGYYTVSLSSFKAGSCMDYNEEDLIVGNEGTGVKSGFTYVGDATTNTVTFTGQPKGDIKYYVWNFGDGNAVSGQSEAKNHVEKYKNAGYYNVCLMVIGQNGKSDIYCSKIGVGTLTGAGCEANFVYGIDSTGKAVTFYDKSFGSPDKWEWGFGDKGTGASQNPAHTYATNDYYLVSLKITNSSSKCTSKTYKLVSINESKGLKVGFGFDAGAYNAKAGGYPVDFIGAGLGDQSRLKWTFGDGSVDTTTSSPVHVYDVAGQYKVCYIAVDDVTGQTDTACQEVQTTNGTLVNNMPVQGSGMNVYPNPFSSTVTIRYSLDTGTAYELAVYDFSGRKVAMLEKGARDKGEYTVIWDAQGIETGSYLLQLKTQGGTLKSVVLVKQR